MPYPNHACNRASAPAVARSRRRLRAAVEALEMRRVLSTIVVNTFVDQSDPPGSRTVSLRDAIAAAATLGGPDTIDVPAGNYPLLKGKLIVRASLGPITIEATGGAATIDAGSKFAAISVPGGNVTLQGLTITGGNADYGAGIDNRGLVSLVNCTVTANDDNAAGAILNAGRMDMSGCTISDNTGDFGGAEKFDEGDALENFGQMSVVNSTVSGNPDLAGANGVAVYNAGRMSIKGVTISANDGGGIENHKNLRVLDCTIRGNGDGISNDAGATINVSGTTISGNSGAGVINGSAVADAAAPDTVAAITGCTISSNGGTGIYNNGALAVARSAIFANTASGPPPVLDAGYGVGCGIENSYGQMTVVNCTVSGNSPGNDNGGSGGIENDSGRMTIDDSTITGNSGGSGAGITNAGTVMLANTIVAGNASGGVSPAGDASGQIQSLGHNLIGDTAGSTGWRSSDLTGTDDEPLDPQLSPLGEYGGPTQTRVPLPGSGAIAAGSVALVPRGAKTDQRGFPRVNRRHVDIGAVELHQGGQITVTPPAPQTVTAGVPASIRLGSFADLGGSGPFSAFVNWGDGSPESSYPLGAGGSLRMQSHTFLKLGMLQGTILVSDAAGDLSNFATLSIASNAGAAQTVTVNTSADSSDPADSSTVSLRDAVARADASRRTPQASPSRLRRNRARSPAFALRPVSGRLSTSGR